MDNGSFKRKTGVLIHTRRLGTTRSGTKRKTRRKSLFAVKEN